MQDMGAAGLTCSSCETASRSGTGIEIDVSFVPQREGGMTPYEILLSESQERMLAILKKGKEKEALEVLKKWNMRAVEVGKVTNDGMMRVKEKGVVVCEIPAEALTKKAPLYDREAKEPAYLKDAQNLNLASIKEPGDLNEVLVKLLDSPTIASKEFAYKNFKCFNKDAVVVNAGSDAAVIKVMGTKKALAISVDCNGRFCYLNPRSGAEMAVAEAARNIVSTGGKPLAITDGLNFGNPMKPENYWQFKECIEGLAKGCKALNTPVISGNVSFYNENPKGAVDPTPIVGMIGLIEDVEKCVTQEFKNEGDVILLLGSQKADLSGSEYLHLVHGQKKGNPEIDLDLERRLHSATLEAIASGILNSAHDCSEGGLAVALSESSIAKPGKFLGADVKVDTLAAKGARTDAILFGEAPSRIVVSVAKNNLGPLEKIAERHSLPILSLGTVGGESLTLQCGGKKVVDIPLVKLSDTWRNAIPSRLNKK